MSMKVLHLYTHWEPDEAYSVLALLDTMREEISAQYGEQIAQMLQQATAATDEQQLQLPFTDLPPF